MKTRLHLTAAATIVGILAAVAAMPGVASAQIVELGATTTPLAAPTCDTSQPLANCKILLTRTTAIESTSDQVINPTRVNQQGWVVAFTVGLSRLPGSAAARAAIIKSQDAQYGGAPSLQLAVLKPEPGNTFAVQAASATYTLTPFLGQVLQEPLSLPPSFSSFTALHVERGDVIGLTVPTWAPVLSYQLPASQFSYRQSRRLGCKNTAAVQTAQTKVGQSAVYGCYYTGTRVEYSATEVTDTVPPKKYVGDVAARR